jgi:hypothetical protein
MMENDGIEQNVSSDNVSPQGVGEMMQKDWSNKLFITEQSPTVRG